MPTRQTKTEGRSLRAVQSRQKGLAYSFVRSEERPLAQARKEGRPHGRPRTASLKADEVHRLKAEQFSHSEIARRLGIGRTSVRRILTAG